MSIRTSEQLKQLFQQSKKQKEKQKLLNKQKKEKERKLLEQKADELLKEEKQRNFQKLLSLLKKEPKKQPSYLFLHNTKYVEEEPFWWIKEDISKEDILKMEQDPNETGRINWSKWDKIMATPLFPNGMPKTEEQPKKGKIKVTVIDAEGYERTFPSIAKAAKAYGIYQGSMQHLLKTGKTHKKLNIQVYEREY